MDIELFKFAIVKVIHNMQHWFLSYSDFLVSRMYFNLINIVIHNTLSIYDCFVGPVVAYASAMLSSRVRFSGLTKYLYVLQIFVSKFENILYVMHIYLQK